MKEKMLRMLFFLLKMSSEFKECLLPSINSVKSPKFGRSIDEKSKIPDYLSTIKGTIKSYTFV